MILLLTLSLEHSLLDKFKFIPTSCYVDADNVWTTFIRWMCCSVRKESCCFFSYGLIRWWVGWAYQTHLPKLQVILVMPPLGPFKRKIDTKFRIDSLIRKPLNKGLFIWAKYSVEIGEYSSSQSVNKYLFSALDKYIIYQALLARGSPSDLWREEEAKEEWV